jgi:very-short-patch-repair endonuclease
MSSAPPWWAIPPQGEVSYLAGADPVLLSISLDPLPDGAPAVVEFRPAVTGRFEDLVAVLLDELDRAAVALFPRWLPGAEELDGANRLGIAAVRALAAQAAARSSNFGPFLSDLAEHSLRSKAGRPVARAAGRERHAEVRAAGLVRVIAAAYGCDSAAVLIHVPDGLRPSEQRVLASAAEWLAHHGRLTVWLAGGSLDEADHVRPVVIALPPDLVELTVEAAGTAPAPTQQEGYPPPVVTWPALSGQPRADSEAELAMEVALSRHKWAGGRHWNYTIRHDTLSKSYRLDLFWPVEGVVVEVDGPDHRGRLKFADDRRRDVRLQLLGHVVLRFTNDQVLQDIGTVVLQIEQLLHRRRKDKIHTEMRQHVHG